jgi:transposase
VIGVSCDGRTTIIHAICDVLGRPIALRLTPGNTSGIRAADESVEEATRFKHLVADRGYDATRFRVDVAPCLPSS